MLVATLLDALCPGRLHFYRETAGLLDNKLAGLVICIGNHIRRRGGRIHPSKLILHPHRCLDMVTIMPGQAGRDQQGHPADDQVGQPPLESLRWLFLNVLLVIGFLLMHLLVHRLVGGLLIVGVVRILRVIVHPGEDKHNVGNLEA